MTCKWNILPIRLTFLDWINTYKHHIIDRGSFITNQYFHSSSLVSFYCPDYTLIMSGKLHKTLKTQIKGGSNLNESGDKESRPTPVKNSPYSA